MSVPIICLAGKNSIAVDAMIQLIKRGWKKRIVVCTNQTDNGASSWQPSLLRFSREFGIRNISLDEAQQIQDLIFISLEFDKIIRPSSFKSRRLYNIHFSSLPAYKGMYTSALPILHGEERSGVTLHEIDSGIDTGPIIAQTVFNLPQNCTARDLYYLYLEHGRNLFEDHLDALISDVVPSSNAQSPCGSTYYSQRSIDYQNTTINLRDTANGVIRCLRAFSFREYQTPKVAGMEIGGWSILPDRSKSKPGQILWIDTDTIVVSTIDYDLELKRHLYWQWFAVTAETEECDVEKLDTSFIDTLNAQGWSPLICAAYQGDAALCRLLLKEGANPNIGNMNGTTPIMYAYSAPDSTTANEVAKILVSYGAEIELRDRFGKSLADYHDVG